MFNIPLPPPLVLLIAWLIGMDMSQGMGGLKSTLLNAIYVADFEHSWRKSNIIHVFFSSPPSSIHRILASGMQDSRHVPWCRKFHSWIRPAIGCAIRIKCTALRDAPCRVTLTPCWMNLMCGHSAERESVVVRMSETLKHAWNLLFHWCRKHTHCIKQNSTSNKFILTLLEQDKTLSCIWKETSAPARNFFYILRSKPSCKGANTDGGGEGRGRVTPAYIRTHWSGVASWQLSKLSSPDKKCSCLPLAQQIKAITLLWVTVQSFN